MSPSVAAYHYFEMSDFIKPPGYNNHIPSSIYTEDLYETRLGNLEFFDGQPLPSTVKLAYEYLDLSRGIQSFLNGMPAASLEALRRGCEKLGATACSDVVIMKELMDSDPLFLTGNTDTVYAFSFLDTKRDGPIVVEIPKDCGPGFVNSAFFRFVVDMGSPGPDQGKGGTYLICPPEYDSVEFPIGSTVAKVEINGERKDVFVVRSPTYVNWLIVRGFLVDGKPDTAVENFTKHLKVYPLGRASNPPEMKFISGSKKPFNTIHSNTYAFYEELAEVIEREPIGMLDPELRGLFASIGIQKGKPFEPDDRMKNILTQAVAVGNAVARSIWIRPRIDGAYYYENSGWYTAFVGGNHEFIADGGDGGRNLDARVLFHYMATGITPAMCEPKVGVGSQYALCNVDENGKYLHGDRTYKLTLPPGIPAEDFWSVVAYDPQTRSQLQTSQPFPSVNDMGDTKPRPNRDGSVDIYFGPEAPKGWKNNWIETQPEKGWFACLRLYGPGEAWFKKTWRPSEIVEVK